MEAGRKYFLSFTKSHAFQNYSCLLCMSSSEWAQRVKPADGLIKKLN